MKTLFDDFSKWHFLVIATLQCHNFKTSGPILITLASFSWECYVPCCKKSQNSRKYPCDSFWEVGSHIYDAFSASTDWATPSPRKITNLKVSLCQTGFVQVFHFKIQRLFTNFSKTKKWFSNTCIADFFQ